MDITPIHALLDEQNDFTEEACECLVEADLIFGVDVMSRTVYFLYGEERLHDEDDLATLVVEFDDGTDEQMRLVLAVKAVKGSRH